jgi:hypothetical protein
LPSPLVGINSPKASKNVENPQAAKKMGKPNSKRQNTAKPRRESLKNIEKIIQSRKNIKKTGDEKLNEEPRPREGGDEEVCT